MQQCNYIVHINVNDNKVGARVYKVELALLCYAGYGVFARFLRQDVYQFWNTFIHRLVIIER